MTTPDNGGYDGLPSLFAEHNSFCKHGRGIVANCSDCFAERVWASPGSCGHGYILSRGCPDCVPAPRSSLYLVPRTKRARRALADYREAHRRWRAIGGHRRIRDNDVPRTVRDLQNRWWNRKKQAREVLNDELDRRIADGFLFLVATDQIVEEGYAKNPMDALVKLVMSPLYGGDEECCDCLSVLVEGEGEKHPEGAGTLCMGCADDYPRCETCRSILHPEDSIVGRWCDPTCADKAEEIA